METEFNYKPAAPKGPQINPKLMRLLPIIGVVLVAIVVILFLVTQKHNDVPDPGYRLHATGLLGTKNFATIQGNDLYSYNGLAFYKTSLSDGKVTVLQSGLKLPRPVEIRWGSSNGAIMTFDRSFAGSIIEAAIRERGERLTTKTKAYSWYVNFAEGTISLVSTQPLEPETATYSAKDNGYYYVTRSDDGNSTSLGFFDANTRESTVVAANTDFLVMTDLRTCEGYRICLRVKNTSDYAHDRLYGLDSSNKLQELFNSKGRIFATNDPNRYVTFEDLDNTDAKQSSEKKAAGVATSDAPEDTDYPPAPAKLYDLRQKTTTDLGFEISQTNVDVWIGSDNHFQVFDDSYTVKVDKENVAAYRAGAFDSQGKVSSSLFPLLDTSGKSLDGKLLSYAHGSSATLATNSDDKEYVFSNSSNLPNLQAENPEKVIKTVAGCKSGDAKTVSYSDDGQLFTIELVDDDNFAGKIINFSNCVAQKGASTLTGYNYKFDGLDPFNGRLSTD